MIQELLPSEYGFFELVTMQVRQVGLLQLVQLQVFKHLLARHKAVPPPLAEELRKNYILRPYYSLLYIIYQFYASVVVKVMEDGDGVALFEPSKSGVFLAKVEFSS